MMEDLDPWEEFEGVTLYLEPVKLPEEPAPVKPKREACHKFTGMPQYPCWYCHQPRGEH